MAWQLRTRREPLRAEITPSTGIGRSIRVTGRTIVLGLLESRPVVQVMFLGRFLAGAALTGSAGTHLASLAVGAVAWIAAAVAVYVVNGIMDVTEDRGNGSRRPIASGRLPQAHAAVLTACAAALALGLGIAAGIAADTLVFLASGYLYSGPPRPAKRSGVAACVVVAILGLTTFHAGMEAVHGHSTAAVVFALIMCGWMTLVGALAKDITDVPGDALAGRRTFAIRYGVAPVARCTAALAVALAATGITAAALLAPILTPSMLTLGAGAYRVARDCRSLTGADAKDPYRSFMLTQYATLGMAGITLVVRYAL